MDAIHHSLARANGWGSAGQCPATPSAKTPAARESGATSWRSSGCANSLDGDASPDGTAQPADIHLLRAELAQLRQAAYDYYVQSDMTHLTRDGSEVADRLARLLIRAGFAA
jgi:hypothetical protein